MALDEPPPSVASVADAAPADAVAAATIALRRTPPARRPLAFAFSLIVGVLPAITLPLVYFTLDGALSVDVAAVIAVACCFGVVGLIVWLFALPRPAPVIVDDDSLRFPFARRGVVRLALEEILVCRVDHGDLVLLAAVADPTQAKGSIGAFVVPRRCFVDVGGAAAVEAAVRQRLARHPSGPGLLARLDDNAARQVAFARKRPLVTWGVVGACVCFFVVEVLVGAFDDPTGRRLLLVGANGGAQVRDGEVWRVVTACLLHGSLLHLAVNTTSLLSTGALIERWLGKSAYAIVLFGSGVVGHVASAVWPRAPMSVGISGAVFGLVGVLAWSTLRYRGATLGGLRVPLSGWVLLVLANGAISALPFVDVVAHGAGFVAGVAIAVVVAPRPGRPPVASPRQRFIAALVAAAVVVAAVVAGVASALG